MNMATICIQFLQYVFPPHELNERLLLFDFHTLLNVLIYAQKCNSVLLYVYVRIYMLPRDT